MTADPSYKAKVYRKQGGDELVVASGGVITVESGGSFDPSGCIAPFNLGTQANLKASGVPLSSSIIGALQVFSDDNGASVADSVRGLRSRTLLTYDQAAGTIRARQCQRNRLTSFHGTT